MLLVLVAQVVVEQVLMEQLQLLERPTLAVEVAVLTIAEMVAQAVLAS
jgi:hypothetical protein